MPEFDIPLVAETHAASQRGPNDSQPGATPVGPARDASGNGFQWGVAARLDETHIPDRTAIAHMSDAGVDAYRFTVGWSAVMPEHDGELDEAGLERFSALVDGLLGSGIEPIVTLGHGSLPARLRAEGWASTNAPIWFANFAGAVGARLGDRVDIWETMRDPFIALEPETGRQRSPELFRPTRAVTQHLLEAHRGAVGVLRAHCPGATIGLSIDLDRGNCQLVGVDDVVEVAVKTGWLSKVSSAAPIDVLGIRYDRNNDARGIDDLIRRLETSIVFPGYVITDGTIGEPLDRSAVGALTRARSEHRLLSRRAVTTSDDTGRPRLDAPGQRSKFSQ